MLEENELVREGMRNQDSIRLPKTSAFYHSFASALWILISLSGGCSLDCSVIDIRRKIL